MKKNTKKILSIMTVAGLSVSTLSSNIENLANAKEDITSIAELTNSADRLSTEIIENEAGAVIRVSAHANIQNVKTTYSVDNTKSQVVSFGDLKAGEVREIQVNLDENCNTAKVLPKTSVVSDKVEFSKEIRCHKIKGNVSFEYDNGLKPSQPTKPSKPEVPSTPETPEKPSVDGLLPADEDVLRALQFILDDAHKGHKIEYKNVSVDKNVDLEVEYVDDDTLEEGKIVLKRAGSPMVVRTITREIYVDGVHIPKYTMLMDRIEIKQGVAKVYARGTKKVGAVKPTDPAKPEQPGTPEKPETPEKPAETDIEAGLPKNVKWTRTQLVAWGFQLGKITGNYNVDGDLGVFNSEDEMDAAYKAGIAKIDDMIKKHEMTIDEAEKTPHGYSWSTVTKEDGSEGYRANLYGSDSVPNDKAPETPEKPGTPETPEKPEAPETPEKPGTPETPEKPEAPETPEKPEAPETPEKPEAPEVDPALEVGMPDGVKWSRTYLSKKLGLELGQLTGNYEIDGDLGVFKTEDELSDAYDRAADQWDKDWINKKITDEEYQKLPKGFTPEEVTLPDGSKGFKANFFGKDGKTNDGQLV